MLRVRKDRDNRFCTPAVLFLLGLVLCLAGCSDGMGLKFAGPGIQTLAPRTQSPEPTTAMPKITIITSDETTVPEATLPAETVPAETPEESTDSESGSETDPEITDASESDGETEPETELETSESEADRPTAAENIADALIDITPGRILSEEDVASIGADTLFWRAPIDDEIFARIYGKSYRDGCPVLREDLRYMQLLHYDLNGNIHVGEMISNYHITDVLLSIFRQLYDAHYPIEKMVLVDEYGADDEASSSDNNTSCFNFRSVANTNNLSYHAKGLAVNINPLYNPYIISGYNTDGEKVCTPVAGVNYLDRTQEYPYKINPDDLCVRLFKEAGFTWGGDWKYTPDYMHFDCRGFGY